MTTPFGNSHAFSAREAVGDNRADSLSNKNTTYGAFALSAVQIYCTY